MNIKQINVTNTGNNYTQAIAVISNAPNDTSGQLGAATITLEGQYGTLRMYYNNALNVKTVLNTNIGTVDYVNGIIILNGFNPIDVDNALGQLAISANPSSTIISSTFDKIITVDPFDPNAITINVLAQ